MNEQTWSPDVQAIGDQIAGLTLVQAVQLSEYLEEVHGIKASGGVPQYEIPPPPPPPPAPEKLEFDVILDGYDETKKIAVIKVYREISGAAIKEAKDFIEGGKGKPIKQGLAKAEAEAVKAKMEAAGAKISIS